MIFSPQDFIRKIVGNDKIRVVDIGAREGFSAFPKLRRETEILAIEPELSGAEKLITFYNKENFAGFHVVQKAIGSSHDEGVLNITRRESMSSLLEPDYDGFRRHFNRVKRGQEWLEFLRIERKQSVALSTLPDVLAEYGWNCADFLKIDTQGTELDILKSCTELLKNGSISVVEVEVSFIPVYKKQAYFSSVDQFMRGNGFHMIDLRTYPEFVQKLRSVNFGSEIFEPPKYNTVGDAVYVRHTFGSDRKQALRSAILLASEGLFSEADYIIGSELSRSEKDQLFRYLSEQRIGSKLKSGLKRLLPPVFLYAWFRMKSKS